MKRITVFWIIWFSILLAMEGNALILFPPSPGVQSGDQLVETYGKAFGEEFKNDFADLAYLSDLIFALKNTQPPNFLCSPDAIDIKFARKDILIHKISDLRSRESIIALLKILDDEDSLYWKYRLIRILNKSLDYYLDNEKANEDEMLDIMTRCFSSYCKLVALTDDLWDTPARLAINFRLPDHMMTGPYLALAMDSLFTGYKTLRPDIRKLLIHINAQYDSNNLSPRARYNILMLKAALGDQDAENLRLLKSVYFPSEEEYERGKALYKESFPDFQKRQIDMERITPSSKESQSVLEKLNKISGFLESYSISNGEYPTNLDTLKDSIENEINEDISNIFIDDLNSQKNKFEYTSDGTYYLLQSSFAHTFSNPYLAAIYERRNRSIIHTSSSREDSYKKRHLKELINQLREERIQKSDFQQIKTDLQNKTNEISIEEKENLFKRVDNEMRLYKSTLLRIEKFRIALEAYNLKNKCYPQSLEQLNKENDNYLEMPEEMKFDFPAFPKGLFNTMIFDLFVYDEKSSKEELVTSEMTQVKYFTDTKGETFVLLFGFLSDDFALLEPFQISIDEPKKQNQAIISSSINEQKLVVTESEAIFRIKDWLINRIK